MLGLRWLLLLCFFSFRHVAGKVLMIVTGMLFRSVVGVLFFL